jgi:circadian clock protein KaiC
MPARKQVTTARRLPRCPTGIRGLDEITEGGLPRGRPTLVCGAAGSGKTLLGMEFLVRGITEFGEPGVFLSFEETAEELGANVASLGFQVPKLLRAGKLAIDFVRVERSEIAETGEYDLEGLFVRLGAAIAEVGAKRVVLDTIEALFAGLPNEAILRAELRRLFRWLKAKGVTALITGEQGDGQLTRHGLEEYVSDCVIVLDHRVVNQVATRRLRVAKYRGARHGTTEYPTLIDETGLSVLPISSLGLTYPVSTARIGTGIPRLDTMLGGQGYYRGSSVLISGTAGTGKTSLAASFVQDVCRGGGTALYCAFEESPEQICRNMRSIGLDLGRWHKAGALRFHAVRPTVYGLEMHLATLHKFLGERRPTAVVLDPITNLMSIGDPGETRAMLTRVIDFAKGQGITAVFTSLTGGGEALEQSEVGISSLMDTWLLVRMLESHGERNRLLYVLKSRGMAHSNQMREFRLTDAGIELRDVYLGPGSVLTGAARLAQEGKDQAELLADQEARARRARELTQEQAALEAQAAALRARAESLRAEREALQRQTRQQATAADRAREALAAARQADPSAAGRSPRASRGGRR